MVSLLVDVSRSTWSHSQAIQSRKLRAPEACRIRPSTGLNSVASRMTPTRKDENVAGNRIAKGYREKDRIHGPPIWLPSKHWQSLAPPPDCQCAPYLSCHGREYNRGHKIYCPVTCLVDRKCCKYARGSGSSNKLDDGEDRDLARQIAVN